MRSLRSRPVNYVQIELLIQLYEQPLHPLNLGVGLAILVTNE